MGSIIYVLCPAKAVTGGPEALHQFTFIARKLGYDCRLVYYPQSRSTPHTYLKYPLKKSAQLPKQAQLILLPEVFIQAQDLPQEATKIIWWLSWDNAPLKEPSIFHSMEHLHLFQSHYAYKRAQALQKGFSRGLLLGDALSFEHLHLKKNTPREEIIFYNPSKGYYWTRQLMQRNPDLKWVALQGLNPEKLSQLLKTGKIYIDFGHSPGQDRLPREAACSDLCILTSKLGAFSHAQDTPLDERYQFDLPQQLVDDPTRKVTSEEELILQKISITLRDCLTNYADRLQDFQAYKRFVKDQSALFSDQIEALMKLLSVKKIIFFHRWLDEGWFVLLRLGRGLEQLFYATKRFFMR